MALVLLAMAVVPTTPFVAVVMPPWSAPESAVAAVAAAGGSLVAPARVDWIVIAHSEDKDFVSRLRQAGAWLVLDQKAFSGCSPKP